MREKPISWLVPDDWEPLAHLELISIQLVDGYLSGRHRSLKKGGCSEFAQHRSYAPGDEVRHVDWRVYAKHDRYCIKQFEEETNLNAVLVLDASGSMGFGLSTRTKFACARAACASLARLALKQRDPVGLSIVSERGAPFLAPRSAATQYANIVELLGKVAPAGSPLLTSRLDELGKTVKRRGMFLIFSDFFVPQDQLLKVLKFLRANGHQVCLFQTLAPEELEFTFRRGSRFESLESDDDVVNLDPDTFRETYIERMKAFLAGIRRICRETGCDYVPMNTSRSVGVILADFLRRRAQTRRAAVGNAELGS
ncbi:DUF58 domain-containing protein [soil metagenome]